MGTKLRPLPPPIADRAVVTWEGPGEPITLTLYGPDGEATASTVTRLEITFMISHPAQDENCLLGGEARGY